MEHIYKNLTASAEVKSTPGKLRGMYVNSTTAGTIRFNDGDSGTPSAGVKATGVFTGSGLLADGEVVVIGNRTYTFVDALDNNVPNQVLIDTLAITLDNLKAAINADTGAGTAYSLNTTAHTQVVATTNTDTAQTIEAIVVGTAANSLDTTTDAANASWGAAVLEGGVDVNTTINNTITPAIGYHDLGDCSFNQGLYATIGGTLNVTLYYA